MAINKEKFSLQNKIKYLISNPNLFFERIKNENTIKDAFLLDLIIRTFIAALLYFFVFSIVVIIGEDWNNYYSFIILPAIFLFFFIGILKNFIFSGLIYLVLKAYKIKGDYQKTYNVYVYSSIPYLVLFIIPYIGVFSIIYSYYLMIIGMSRVHNISIGKSALACLLPIIIFISIFIILILWFLKYAI